jgi:hypothetical protein
MNDFLRVLSYAGDYRPLMIKAVTCLTLSVFCAVERPRGVNGLGDRGGEAQ